MTKNYNFSAENLKYLRSEPLDSDRFELFDELDPEGAIVGALNSLRNAIVYEGTGCYLISGFRGTGKSSLINAAVNKASNAAIKYDTSNPDSNNDVKTLVISWAVNVGDAPKSDVLLRRLIRGFTQESINCVEKVKLNLEKTAPSKQEKKENLFQNLAISLGLGKEITDSQTEADTLLEELRLAHNRTFYNVTETKNDDQSQLSVATRIFGFDFAKFFPWVVSVITFLGFSFNIGTVIKAFDGWAWSLIAIFVLVAALVVFLLSSYNLTRKLERTRVKKENLETKTLYDEEIAETNFLRLLSEVKKRVPNICKQDSHEIREVRIVCVIDEVDKIEDSDALDKLLPMLKNILLSGRAFFVLAAGKQTYYDTVMATRTQEDDVLSSLFTQVITMPIFSATEIRGVYKRIIPFDDPNYKPLLDYGTKDKEKIGLFCSLLNLQARGVARRFLSQFRRYVRWKGELCSLALPEIDEKELWLYFVLEQALEDVVNKHIRKSDIEEGEQDFLQYRLFIYVLKMLRLPTKAGFRMESLLEEVFLPIKPSVKVKDPNIDANGNQSPKEQKSSEADKKPEVAKEKSKRDIFYVEISERLRNIILELLETLANLDRNNTFDARISKISSLGWLRGKTSKELQNIQGVIEKVPLGDTILWRWSSDWRTGVEAKNFSSSFTQSAIISEEFNPNLNPQTVSAKNQLNDQERLIELEQLLNDNESLLYAYRNKLFVENDLLEITKLQGKIDETVETMEKLRKEFNQISSNLGVVDNYPPSLINLRINNLNNLLITLANLIGGLEHNLLFSKDPIERGKLEQQLALLKSYY
jgi:hypothetical protein